jgi:hypothetical protein
MYYFGGFGWPGFLTPVVSYAPLQEIIAPEPETGERIELIHQGAVNLIQG